LGGLGGGVGVFLQDFHSGKKQTLSGSKQKGLERGENNKMQTVRVQVANNWGPKSEDTRPEKVYRVFRLRKRAQQLPPNMSSAREFLRW